jgi:tetratricopeptide (TPR) repeat protein
VDEGVKLLQAGKPGEAWKLVAQLLKQYPASHQVQALAADTASLLGDRAGAIDHIQTAAELAPDNGLIQLRRAQLLFNDSRRAAARVAANTAASMVDTDERQLRALARVLSDCLDLEGARALLLDAHARLPDSGAILADLAVTEFQLNLPDEAEAHLEALLAREPFNPAALHLRSQLRKQTAESNHVDDIEDRLSRGPDHPNLVAGACYALAKEYEDLEQYSDAFEALTRGARAFRSTITYSGADELGAQADIRERFTADTLAGLSPGYQGAGPIFVIGMPRTGTTLVERLLSSHSQAVTIGEFTDFPALLSDQIGRTQLRGGQGTHLDLSLQIDFSELGRRYMTAARDLAGDSPYFVDKLPFNFLYCGYILAALPDARIINLVRDPLDTCYAVFKTLFFGAYSFSYDLDELADYFISYRRHMQHWHEVLPGRILDVSYEALVQNPEPETRRLLEWCGLPWEAEVMEFHTQDRPAVTASAMQVRRPFYTESIGAWQRAGSGLDELRRKLEDAGLVTA